MEERRIQRKITIDARAEREFEPDMYCVKVEFEGEGSSKDECTQAYNVDYQNVLDALAKAGIVADQIKNGAFMVSVHYEWYYEKVKDSHYQKYRRTERYIDGYEYHGSCSFERAMDLGEFADVWSALQTVEGDFSFSVEYKLAHPDECEASLLREAVAEAHMRAAVLAEATGEQLGRVASIDHRFIHASQQVYREELAVCCGSTGGGLNPIDKAPLFNPEGIEIGCAVTVAWEIA